MKDRRGVDINVGDLAVHASSGRYGSYDVVRVAGFTPKMVKVDRIDYMDRHPFMGREVATNLTPDTLIVVTLPKAVGRLNH